ncbi:MAG: hypothetical protein IPO77_10035 [Acidobacteria bacterium]|nr:hypothetical protein [Acidobacteriota bacterium]
MNEPATAGGIDYHPFGLSISIGSIPISKVQNVNTTGESLLAILLACLAETLANTTEPWIVQSTAYHFLNI